METSAVTEALPTQTLQIRPVTVITNTLNAFSAICSLKNSPLLDLVLNPLSSPPESSTANVTYKGYVSIPNHFNIDIWIILKFDIRMNMCRERVQIEGGVPTKIKYKQIALVFFFNSTYVTFSNSQKLHSIECLWCFVSQTKKNIHKATKFIRSFMR